MPVFGPKFMGRSAGFQIQQSCRFNDDDSAFLNRTPAASNRDTWTFSVWFKRGNVGLGSDTYLLSAGADGNNYTAIRITNTDKLRYVHVDAAVTTDDVVSTPIFRDPTAWYHIVVAVDTTLAPAATSIRMYVNGVEITAFDTANYPAAGVDTDVNAAVNHEIARYVGGGASLIDGYMAEVIFVDGQQLTPFSFGEFDAINPSVWKPAPYAGTFGTNGFRLDFANAAAFGADVSGNANTWTDNGLATNDQVSDSPTENWCVWNRAEKASGVSFANGNLDASIAAAVDGSSRGTLGAQTGRWVFEVTPGGTVGVQTIGIGNADVNLAAADTLLGGLHYLYRDDGNKIVNGVATAYGATWIAGDVIRCEFDLDGGSVEFFKNNVSQGSITITETGETWFPVAGTTGNDEWVGEFGQGGFANTPTAGFKALTTKNLPAVDVRQPQKFFNTVLYEGTGAVQSITGVGFLPDSIWGKNRDVADDHWWHDDIRGATAKLVPDTAAAEITAATGLTSFDADGFSLGTGVGHSGYNDNLESHVAWCLKELAGFFDIVSYVGTGVAHAESHSLGVVPGVMIVKNRNDANNWRVYHEDEAPDPETDFLALDVAAAAVDSAAAWNDTAPTSNQFTVGTEVNVNTNGDNYIAYLFGEKSGLCAIGNYVGNADTEGPFVYCGFRPAFVLTKKVLTAGRSWVMRDAAREPLNPVTLSLLADATSIDSSGVGDVDFLATGFKVRTTDAQMNTTGGVYVFIAFAEAGIGRNVAPPNAR